MTSSQSCSSVDHSATIPSQYPSFYNYPHPGMIQSFSQSPSFYNYPHPGMIPSPAPSFYNAIRLRGAIPSYGFGPSPSFYNYPHPGMIPSPSPSFYNYPHPGMIPSYGFSQSTFVASKTFPTSNQQDQQNVKEKDTPLNISSISQDSSDESSYVSSQSTIVDEIIVAEDSKYYKDMAADYHDTLSETQDKENRDKLDTWLDYNRKVQHFIYVKPRIEQWIASWSEIKIPVRYWLSVYGYFDKLDASGGYGVILRDIWSEPIIAATCYTKEGRSKLFQVLNGLKTGLQLTARQQSPRVAVVCNVQKAVDILGSSTFQEAGDYLQYINSDSHEKTNGICKECTKCGAYVKPASLENVISELKQLKREVDDIIEFSKVPRQGNEAAHYLAKMAKEWGPHGVNARREITPDVFPPPLNQILYWDAFCLETKYSKSLFSRFQMVTDQKKIVPTRNQ